MAGLSKGGYRERQKEQRANEQKEFGLHKSAVRKLFQQLPLNSLFKQIVIKLLDMSYVDRICNPSLKFLGLALSRHPKVIARHVRAIEEIGLFQIERTKAKGKNLANRYVINWDCKVWYLVGHPDYRDAKGQAVLAKLQEIIRKNTQTKLIAAKSRGTVCPSAEQEPYHPAEAVTGEPYGSPEQEPYVQLTGTVRFHKLPQERGRHGQSPVDVPEPQQVMNVQVQDNLDVQVRQSDAAAPHRYLLDGCEGAAVQHPQSSDQVSVTTNVTNSARNLEDVQHQSLREPFTAEQIEAIRAYYANYDPDENDCD